MNYSEKESSNVVNDNHIIKCCHKTKYLHAEYSSPWKVITSLLCNIFIFKGCTLLMTFLISFAIVELLSRYNVNLINGQCTSSELINWNVAVVSICIAGLAILFGFFAERRFDSEGKEAFKEQLTTILLCCFIHIIALFITLLTTNTALISFFQLLSVILFLDMLIELYTMATAITCIDYTDNKSRNVNEQNILISNQKQNEER